MAATEDEIPAKDESQWYKALFEEDCMVVMELLDVYPSLVLVGWESEPSRQISGRKRREGTGRTQSSWKGRTALHVGASRGCVKLIMQVLRIFNLHRPLHRFSMVNEAYEKWSLLDQTPAGEPQGEPEIEPQGEPEIAESEGPSISGFLLDNVIQENDPPKGDERAQAETSGSTSKRLLRKLQKTILTNGSRSADDKRKVKAQQSFCRVEQQHMKKNYSNPSALSHNYVSKMDGRDLLLAKDGGNGLDALAIAVLYGTKEIIYLLLYCARELDDQAHYDKMSIDALRASTIFHAMGNMEKRKLLRQVTVAAVMTFIEIVEPDLSDRFDESIIRPPPSTMHRRAFYEYLKLHDASTTFLLDTVKGHLVFKDYFEHRDFSFLPPEEYLFHFLCTKKFRGDVVESGMIDTLWAAVKLWQRDVDLWHFLLKLTDGQGRPPFHIAMDYSNETNFITVLRGKTNDMEAVIVAMTACDRVGRSPVKKAAIEGSYDALSRILDFAVDYDVVASTCEKCAHLEVKDLELCGPLNFPLKFPFPQTPLHAALINKNFSCAELLLTKSRELKFDEVRYLSSNEAMHSQSYPVPLFPHGLAVANVDEWIEWDLVELACLVGAPPTFLEKLKGDLATPRLYNRICKTIDECTGGGTTVRLQHQWHPLHLAASLGRYDMVKFLIDDLQCDPLVEDFEGNSALHHALKVKEFEIGTHILDYVNVEHYLLSEYNRMPRMGKDDILDANQFAERQGCINLLLQAGCDVFKPNRRKQVPCPTGTLNDNKFLSWWYHKQEEEFTATQNNLKYLANAVTITATLVVTTSYAGPSLGYDANHIGYANGWVSTFIVCDTLSFYFSVAAIVLSLIPWLPVPQQVMVKELRRTWKMVIVAVGILVPSLFCIFVAFTCRSISVMSANITLEVGSKLSIGSTLIGTISCLWVFSLFSINFLASVFPKNTLIRYIYSLAFFPKRFFSSNGNASR